MPYCELLLDLKTHHFEPAERAVFRRTEIAEAGVGARLNEEGFDGFFADQLVVEVHRDGESPMVKFRPDDGHSNRGGTVFHHPPTLVNTPRDLSLFINPVESDELVREFQKREHRRRGRRRDGFLAVFDVTSGVLEGADKVDGREAHLTRIIAVDALTGDILERTVLDDWLAVTRSQAVQGVFGHWVHEHRAEALALNG